MRKEVGVAKRSPRYQHTDRIRELTSEVAEYAAIDRADLIEQILEDQNNMYDVIKSSGKTEPVVGTSLPAKGGEWIIDSGSSFDIVSERDLSEQEKERIYKLDVPQTMYTAQGYLEADKGWK